MKDGRAGLSARRYVALVVAVTIAVCLLVPAPIRYLRPIVAAQALPALRSGARTVMYGASGLDTYSRCDRDLSSLAAMLGSRLGTPVIHAGWGNQTIEESANMAAVVTRTTPVDAAVIASGWLELAEAENLGVHDYMAFRMLNPFLSVTGPSTYFSQHRSVHSRHLKSYEPFVYKGVAYPGLDGLERRLFEPERARRTCPENDGSNAALIAATYYHRMMEYAPAPSNASMLASLHRALRKRGKRLIFVLLPVNMQLLGEIDRDWPGLVRARREAFLAPLTQAGVKIVDLSETLPHEAFTDRWCGCMHFTEAGRSKIADAIAASLR